MLHLDFSKSAIPRGGGGAVRIGVTGSYFSGLEQTYLEQRSMDLDVYDMYLPSRSWENPMVSCQFAFKPTKGKHTKQ